MQRGGTVTETVDVVVLGSGAAGLVAACLAAHGGASVVLVERSGLLGGTTAVSGGMVWVPNNPHMSELGIRDSRDDALAYVRRCAAGHVDDELLEAYVDEAPRMIAHLEARTSARFRSVPRPDYRPEWPGGRPGGRTLDNLPFTAELDEAAPVRPRRAKVPLTHEELVAKRYARTAGSVAEQTIAERVVAGTATLGGALASSLVAGCRDAGVDLRTGWRGRELLQEEGRVVGVRVERAGDGTATAPVETATHQELYARRGVVVATGGFEWSETMLRAFIGRPLQLPVSPPWNEGDGLVMGQRVGAALSNMTEAWWVPTYSVPGETYDGRRLAKHLGAELSLPGSILVNRQGNRFVNESVNYNDLSHAFAVRDANDTELLNVPCWLVFDDGFRRRYQVAGTMPGDTPPAWWIRTTTIEELAGEIGVDRAAMSRTVKDFNASAKEGLDQHFRRGESAHDRFYGDSDQKPNPCLAALEEGPFFAIEVRPGAFGTKGGLAIDRRARVLRFDGSVVPGLYAAGNASGGMTGPGYPGAGATLGAAMTFGYLAGKDLTDHASGADGDRALGRATRRAPVRRSQDEPGDGE